MLSIYLHIPFCRRKCAYCDFFSQPSHEGDLVSYGALLQQQLERYRDDDRWQGPVDTVFFGGGTPSLLPVKTVDHLLQAIEVLYGWSEAPEISLEANPETVDFEKLRDYRQAGVNRLSFGVQSLDEDQLDWLGRGHSSRQARKAVSLAQEAGFPNIGIDLIFGVPGQDTDFLRQELHEVMDWGLSHLSCYGLTYEDNTPLHQRLSAGHFTPLSDEVTAEQFLLVHNILTEAGWNHYEISNYAQPDKECRHNQAYWQRKTCLGLGAGAHSFVAQGWGERWAAPPDLAEYEHRIGRGEDPQDRLEAFDRSQARNETCYLALRTADGIDLPSFESTFGEPMTSAYPRVEGRLKDHLRTSPTHWAFRPESWLLYDHLVQEFL